VGSYQIVPNLNDPNGKLTNYSLNLSIGTLTVSPAQLIVTADDQVRTYGAPNPELTGHVSGVQNGDDITVTYAAKATASSPVGSYPIVPDVNDPDGKLANYSLSVSPVMLRVQPAPVLVQAQNATRVYGHTNPLLSATITGLVNGEDTNVLEGTLELNTTADVNSPVGTYTIELWGLSATNYTLSFSNGTLTIGAAQLIVTADDQVRTYGAPNPELTGQVSGVQNGDNITVSYATEAAASSPVGTYQIAPIINEPGGKLINYQVSSAPGTLTITKASTAGIVTSSANPALAGAMITFTITLSPQQPSSAVPDGAIQTTIDGAVYGTPVTLTGGLAVVTTDQLGAGRHIVTIEYSGNSNFLGTTLSLEPVQVVNAPPPTLTLLTDGPGQYRVALSGMPRTTYWIQWTENLDAPNWQLLNVAMTDSSGYLEIPDSPPQDSISRFYRSMSPTQGSSNLFAAQITSSANPAPPGFPVTFSVTLEPATRNSNGATGSVQFNIDGFPYGPLVPLVAGAASITADDLSLGKHLVSVDFGAAPTLAWPTNALSLPLLINTSPVGGEALLVRNASGGTKTLVSDLMANAFDPDGDPLTLQNYEPQSAQGGNVTIANGWLYYTPPVGNANADSFHYTVTDCWGASASGIARIGFALDKQPAPDQTRLDLGNGDYGIIFWAIPWRHYAVEYAIEVADPQWQFLTAQTADSAGHIEIKGALAEEAATRLYRLVCPLDDVGASPFRLAVWTNFVAQTNGRTTVMWSERSHPPDWPDSPPVLAWNTNCLLYGMDGFTAISQCNQFEGAPGQVPVTLLTRRHAYVRGHGMGESGLWTNTFTGQKVWFCTPSNTVVQMTIAANFTRAGIFDAKSYDYGIIAFTEDVPDSLTPMSVLGSTDFQIYYYQTDDIPFLWLGTEQDGHIATESTIPGFSYPLFKGGDSGSPNIILAPDNKLLFFGGRSTSGPSAQMQADIDALSVCLCLNTNNYQLRWYDVTPWAP
jgi:hypothetical protein